MITLIHHPDDPKRMGDLLVENLSNAKWISFRAAVAFVKSSGVKHISRYPAAVPWPDHRGGRRCTPWS